MLPKLIYFLLLVNSVTNALNAQSIPSPFPLEKVMSAQEQGLKGRVQRMIIRNHPDPTTPEIHTFDRSGRLLERTDNRQEGYRVVYKYDSSGRLVGSDGYLGKDLAHAVQVQLNEDGLPSKALATDLRKRSEQRANWEAAYEYKLDAKGRVIERLTALKNPIGITGGFVISLSFPPGLYREVFRYDDIGNTIEYEFYLPQPENEIPITRTSWKYDSRGRKTEESTPTSFTRGQVNVFRYNDYGDVVELRTYEPVTETTKREVGDRFRMLDSGGTVQNGNLISDRLNNILWDAIKCSYVYDGMGNWTTKTCTHAVGNGTVPQADRPQRTFEYFSN